VTSLSRSRCQRDERHADAGAVRRSMWTCSLGCHCSPILRRWQPAMIGKSLEVSSNRFCTSKQMSLLQDVAGDEDTSKDLEVQMSQVTDVAGDDAVLDAPQRWSSSAAPHMKVASTMCSRSTCARSSGHGTTPSVRARARATCTEPAALRTTCSYSGAPRK